MDLLIAAGGSFLAALLGAAVGLVLGSIRLPAILLASGNAAAAAGTNIAVSAVSALVGVPRGLARARGADIGFEVALGAADELETWSARGAKSRRGEPPCGRSSR
jgi:uncharacterized membrane protein YfcA